MNTTSVRIDGMVPDAPCDGVVLGTALVHGRPVMIHSTDVTVLGGSMAAQGMMKFARAHEMAVQWGIPMVHLLDSSGGRLGFKEIDIAGIDWWFRSQSRYSGVVPQITVLMGPCIAGGAYLPTLCDLLIISRISGNLWLGGPRQTQAATSEVFDKNVGGADYHLQLTGTCDRVGADDEESVGLCREMLRYLPLNYREHPPEWDKTDSADREVGELIDIVPDDLNKPYDMHDVIEVLVDDGEYFEIKDEYAKNLICCFCRFDGRSVGLVANNPKYPGSTLEVNTCDKYYRFLQILDAYNLPLVNLVDEIILPKDTRKRIIEALEITANKEETLPSRKKRHGAAPS